MSKSEKNIWDLRDEEVKLRLTSIDSTQKAIDSLLARIKATSKGNENGEVVPKEYQQAIEKLFFVLFHLPDEVQCVSLSTSFRFLEGEPKNQLEYVIRNLQSYLFVLNPDLRSNALRNIEFDFVVQRPYFPTALENDSADHGSGIRQLINDVIVPIKFGRQGNINLFSIRPHGLKGLASIATASAIDYPVPIRLTTSIQLHKEQLLLTPFLEHTDIIDPISQLETLRIQPANLFAKK